jgi:hypothetical protein
LTGLPSASSSIVSFIPAFALTCFRPRGLKLIDWPGYPVLHEPAMNAGSRDRSLRCRAIPALVRAT